MAFRWPQIFLSTGAAKKKHKNLWGFASFYLLALFGHLGNFGSLGRKIFDHVLADVHDNHPGGFRGNPGWVGFGSAKSTPGGFQPICLDPERSGSSESKKSSVPLKIYVSKQCI